MCLQETPKTLLVRKANPLSHARKRHRACPEFRILHGNHDRLFHAGKGQQLALDALWMHVLSACDEHRILAAQHLQPFPVPAAQIPGCKPAFGIKGLLEPGIREVPEEARFTPNVNHTGFVNVEFPVWQYGGGGFPTIPAFSQGSGRHLRGQFRAAVTGEDCKSQLARLLKQWFRNPCTAQQDELELLQGRTPHCGLQKPMELHGHQREVRDALSCNRAGEVMPIRRDHQRRARQQCAKHDCQTTNVMQGQGQQPAVSRFQRHHLIRPLRTPKKIFQRKRNRLGCSRTPRSEHNERGSAQIHGGARAGRWGIVRNHLPQNVLATDLFEKG